MRSEGEIKLKLAVKRADHIAAVAALKKYEAKHFTSDDFFTERDRLKRHVDAALFGIKALEWVLGEKS